MKFKTIRIKIENDQQDYDVSDYLTGSNTLYDKYTHIVKEDDGLYWHILIFYKPMYSSFTSQPLSDKPDYPEKLRIEVDDILEKHKVSMRIKNAVHMSLKDYKEITKIEHYYQYRNLGRKSIDEHVLALNDIIKVFENYK